MPVKPQTMGSGEAPKQFSQPSRKGKKAWRKNIDVTEVEHGLEELNEEIIRGYLSPGLISCFLVLTLRSQWRYSREKLLGTLHDRFEG